MVGLIFLLGVVQLFWFNDLLNGITDIFVAVVNDLSGVFPDEPALIPLVVLEFILLWLCLRQVLARWRI